MMYYVYESMCGCVHMSTGILKDQKMSDPLEVELWVVVIGLILVLGTELGSSLSAVSTLYCCTISPTLFLNKNDFI